MARPSQFAGNPDGKEASLPPGLVRRVTLARASLWLERAFPRLAGAVAAGALFVALALLGVWAVVPGLVRWLCLVGVSLFLLWTAVRLWRTNPWPSARQGLALIEARSALPRGQLALLHDHPAPGGAPEDGLSGQLWARAREEAARAALRARLPLPRIDVVSADRWGLGALVVLGLVLGTLVAGKDARWRIDDALSPWLTSLANVTVEVVVTPPAYTGRPAAVHTVAGDGHLAVSALTGSTMRLVARGLDGTLALVPPEGEALPFQAVADGLSVSATVKTGGIWRVRHGLRTVVTLDVAVAPDTAPRVALTGEPSVTATQALRLPYRIADDFGVTRWHLAVTRGDETRRFTPSAPPLQGDGVIYMDFTPDPWAGSTVQLRLVALDAAGNKGQSTALTLTLPERRFTHPFARRIIALRKELLEQPASRALVGKKLTEAATDIGAYDGDFSVFAGLRSAFWRLRYDREDPRGWSVARLLWDVAVAVEEGDQGRQLQDLRRSLDELAARMGQASEGELAEMSDRLTQALAAYLSEMISAAPPMASEAEMAGARVLDAAALGDLLSDLRERLAAGDEAGARRALETLRALVENLRSAGSMAGAQASALGEALSGLQNLEARQRETLGQTIGAGLSNALGGGNQALKDLGETQSRLSAEAGALGDRLRQAGLNAPPALGQARRAMAAAAEALGEGRVEAALQAQSRAMEALADAQESLRAQQQQAASGQSPGGAMGTGLDPLGRFSGGGLGPEFRLPDGSERRMVDAIRSELEQKAADPRRSAEERAYYLRLLRQF